MFKKIFSLFSKPPSESPTRTPSRADSSSTEQRRGGNRRRRRKPASERVQGDQLGQRPQGDRRQGERSSQPEQPVDGDAPKKRRRRRRKPASERAANAQGLGPDDASRDQQDRTVRADRPSRGTQDPSEEARLPRRENSGARGRVAEVLTGPQPRTEYFGDIRVSKPVAAGLADMGYEAPTPIQTEVIAPMLAGSDLVGQAQTGTGKTAGFGIPLAEVVDGSLDHIQAIVLVPTRELAQQVTDEITRIVKYRGINIVAVYGGAPIARQIAGLENRAHMVIGTPGRVIDLLNRGDLRLDKVRTVILDEADQMLDIGFLPDIRTILRQTPRERQTALFTATVPTQIRRLIYSYLKEPQTIRVGEESEPAENVRQMYCEVARRDKLDALKEVFETIDAGEQTLVFRRTQGDVDWLVKMLKQRRLPAEAIHGGLRQSERNAVMQNFRDGKVKILVSTNLTSRGIDVPAVAHVINYDCPEQVEEYVHRIGRTARMGRDGTAVTFVGEWDIEFFDAIRDHVGAERLEEINLSMYGDPNRGGPVDEDEDAAEDNSTDTDMYVAEVEPEQSKDEALGQATDFDDEPDNVAQDEAPIAELTDSGNATETFVEEVISETVELDADLEEKSRPPETEDPAR